MHMKRNYRISIMLAGAIILVAGFVYFLYGGISQNIQKVISNDGLAELEVPENALPKGIAIKDISITNVSVDDTMVVYEFKPDGVIFSDELTFKTTIKNIGNIIPIPLIFSKENGIEFASGAEINQNTEKNEVTISLPMAHFSVLIFPSSSAYAFFYATMKAPLQVYIGDIVPAKATIHMNPESVVLFSELNPWAKPLYDADNRIISGLGRHTLGYRLVRDSVKVALKRVDASPQIFQPGYSFDPQSTGEPLTFESRDYRCDQVGFGKIYFNFFLTYNGEAVDVISDGQPGQAGGSLRVGSSLGLERFNKSGGGTIGTGRLIECVARPTVGDGVGTSGASESEAKAVGEIFLNEGQSQTSPTTESPGKVKVCGLPGGPACQKR